MRNVVEAKLLPVIPFLFVFAERTRTGDILSKVWGTSELSDDKTVDNWVSYDENSWRTRIIMKKLVEEILSTNKYLFWAFTGIFGCRYNVWFDKESRDDLATFWMRIAWLCQIFFDFLCTNFCVFFSKVFVYYDFAVFVDKLFNDEIGCSSSVSKITTKNIVKNLIFEFFC